MIPNDINDWTEETVKKLIEAEYEENSTLEYKKVLEGSDNKKQYRLKIERILSSFANSSGGFVIFGIDDNKDVQGLPIPKEPNLFVSKIVNNSVPSINFETKVLQPNGKRVLLVEIKESIDKPVQCSDGSFNIRLNGETIIISRDRLRNWFVSKELKKQRAEKLKFEIDWMQSIASQELNKSALPPFQKLRLNELQDSISEYYGHFKDGCTDLINEINALIADLKKEEKLFEFMISVELKKSYGQSWVDLNGFLKKMQTPFQEVNMKLKSLFDKLESETKKLKGYI